MGEKLDNIFKYLIILLGIISIGDGIFAIIFGSNINFGVIFPFLFGSFLVIFGIVKVILGKEYIIKNRYMRSLSKIIIYSFLISFIVIEAFIYSGIKEDENKGEYIVVLGGGINGKTVTATLAYRLDKAVELMTKDKDIRVVVTGGRGPGEDITEALAMEDYLLNKGIYKNRILKEERATSTYENFKFTKELLKRETGMETFKISIITNDFHMWRSKILARRCGFIAYGVPAPSYKYLLPNFIIREYFAVIKSLIFDRG